MPPPRSPRRAAPPRGGVAAFLVGLAKVVGVLIVVGLIALGASVAVAMNSLPSFDEFRKSPNGQSVEIRGADNSVLVSLGPSYGEWLPFARIPHTMTAAMIAVEDRRFYSHPGVDPVGIARSLVVAERAGHFTQGASTITQQLARNVFLTQNRTFSRKVREIVLSLAIEAQVHQGGDPRALPQPRLFRRRGVRHRRREPQVLRPSGVDAQPARGGDHRRAGQGPEPLCPVGRPGRGARPGGDGHRDDGRFGVDHAGRGRGGRPRQPPLHAAGARERRPLFHRLGCWRRSRR